MAALVIFLWVPYTLIEALFQLKRLGTVATLFLELTPGVVAIAALWASGLSLDDCFCRWRKASRLGWALLALWFIIGLPILFTGRWAGWNPLAALVYAPAGAVTQELYFRAALLPVFLRLFRGKTWRALLAHSALFGLWHVGPLVQGAPPAAVISVMAFPFLSGFVWGWQVQKDKTLAWVIIFHTLSLLMMSFISWG